MFSFSSLNFPKLDRSELDRLRLLGLFNSLYGVIRQPANDRFRLITNPRKKTAMILSFSSSEKHHGDIVTDGQIEKSRYKMASAEI